MSWNALLGQDRAVGRLKALLAGRRLPPALLFHGPPGVGKSTAAFEFSKALNCAGSADEHGNAAPAGRGEACGRCPSCSAAEKGLDLDLKRLDAAYQAGVLGEEAAKQQHIKIDSIRHLVKDMELRSLGGRWKAAVVLEAHTLQAAASNALLKALEEPPPRSLWILVTDRRELLLPTIASRCQAVAFAALPAALVASILASRGVPAAERAPLAAMSEGSPGRALALWERGLPDPATWIADPLAPFRLADELPRELHLSRPFAEDHLRRMAWHVRLAPGSGGKLLRSARRALETLEKLRRQLRANADPRLVVELGALELQRSTAVLSVES